MSRWISASPTATTYPYQIIRIHKAGYVVYDPRAVLLLLETKRKGPRSTDAINSAIDTIFLQEYPAVDALSNYPNMILAHAHTSTAIANDRELIRQPWLVSFKYRGKTMTIINGIAHSPPDRSAAASTLITQYEYPISTPTYVKSFQRKKYVQTNVFTRRNRVPVELPLITFPDN